MAPRSTKAKKADIKVVENEAPKKGRGKPKNIGEQEIEVPESDVNEIMAPSIEKKIKRGKKATNGTSGLEQNGEKNEETVPLAKKSRKKNQEENDANNGHSADEKSASTDANDKQNGDTLESKMDSEETQFASGKGRKKQPKKDMEVKSKESSKGKKNEGTSEEKPGRGKGRGRKAQPKDDNEFDKGDKDDSGDDDVKPEPPSKGRKKGQTKAAKEKSPEGDKKEVQDDKTVDIEVAGEEQKKKETKARKNQGKKPQAKEESEDKEEDLKDEPASKKRKPAKKVDKAKGDSKDGVIEEEVAEVKPAKGKRAQKKTAETHIETEEEPQDTGEQAAKRRRKQAEDKASIGDKKGAPKNKAITNYEELDFSNTSLNMQNKEWNYKISSWNVDGIRAWLGKGGLDFLKYEKPDILCLQEVKCSQDKLPDELNNVPGYHSYWLCSDQDGYAGVGIYTTKLAMNVQYGLQNEELDSEGRIITAEYEHFYLISTYVPNAGRKLVTLPKRLKWNEEFRKYVKELDKKKPVIICGDMNVAHNEIDLANPKTNRKNAGFTDEERSGMTELLGDGFVDTFRHLNPDKKSAYTFWTYMMNSRAKNVGWRLDYFIVSERLLSSLCDSVIRDGVYGSDHCPISLFMHLSSAEKPK